MNMFVDYFNSPEASWHDDVAGRGDSPKNKQRAIIHANRYRVVDSLLPHRENLRILDFACGSGDYLLSLLARGHDGYGIDLASNLIQTAQANAAAAGLPTDRWLLGGYDAWPKKQFDVVLALSVMLCLSEEEEATFFAVARKHLAEDGVLICNFYNMFTDLCTFNEFTVELVLKAYADAGLIQGGTPSMDDVRNELGTMLPFARKSSNHRGGSARTTIPFRGRNPFSLPRELAKHGFTIEDGVFTRFHLLPPELVERPENLSLFERQVRHTERYHEAQLGPYFANNLTLRLRPCRT